MVITARSRILEVGPAEGVAALAPGGRMRRAVERLAAARAPVLLVGPPGRGKRWVLRALHAAAGGGLLRLIEPSPTHATDRDVDSLGNLVGAAVGGTLAVPSLDLLPLRWQASLAASMDRCPAMIIATLDRESMPIGVDSLLRRDLLDRFIPLQVPALRERQEDIVHVARAAMAAAAAHGGIDALPLGDIASARLRRHGWPGDCAEMERFAARAVALRSVEAALGDLTSEGMAPRMAWSDACERLTRGEPIQLETVCRRVVRQAERGWIESVAAAAAGDARKLAALLGLTPLALSVKLRDLGLPETGSQW